MKKIHKSGFTMIELMVVIALIGILAGVGINGFADGKARHECEFEAGRIRDFLNEGNSQSAKISQPIPLQVADKSEDPKIHSYILEASKTSDGVTFWSGIKQGTAHSCPLGNVDSCELLTYPATDQLMSSTLTLNTALTKIDEKTHPHLVLRGRKPPYVSSTGDIKETGGETDRMPVIRIRKGRYTALIAPKTGGSIAMYMVKTDNSGTPPAGAKYFTIK
ncbi:MAG: prepilin-type N-terminal cleavage/methylation domain-containing protein [bacterium]|nr:prepilin-type N-terminal cleavage/methylation domain-containing protein [bacterium]